jgi:hypothetical protein
MISVGKVKTIYPEKNEDFIGYKKNVISGGNIYWAHSYWSRTNQEHYNRVMINKGKELENTGFIINYKEEVTKKSIFNLFITFFKK